MFLKRKIFLQIKDRDRRLAELDDDYNQLKSQSQHDDPDMDSHSNRVCHSWFYFDWNLLNRSILQEKQNYQQQIQVCITQIRILVDLNMNSCRLPMNISMIFNKNQIKNIKNMIHYDQNTKKWYVFNRK